MFDKLKDIVGKAAPMLGMALGGPLGKTAGSMVASVLGTENDEDQMLAALQNNPEAMAKLKQIEAENERELRKMNLEAASKDLAQQHQTIRAELASDNWYKSGWRPTIGWVLALSLAAIMGGLAYSIFVQPGKAAEIMSAASGVLMFMAGLLGYNAKKRSDDKAMAAGFQPRTIGDAIGGLFGARK